MANNQTQKRSFTVRRMALNGMLIAVYEGLTLLTIPLGGLKITFEALPILISALLFGPVDGMLVGFLGEFLNQMLTFGFTPTTLLWVLPAVTRGAFVGLCMGAMKKRRDCESVLSYKKGIPYFVVCILSAVITSCINTVAFYVDSKMFGYYSYAAVFGVFWIRILTGMVSSGLMAAASIPVVKALKRTKFI